jgi:flagellar protein FliO/FliZ
MSATIEFAGSIATLGGAAAAMVAIAWGLRRLRGHGPVRGVEVRTLGSASLGTRERVVVVQVGPRTLVLGVTPHNVGLLAELPGGPPDAREAARATRAAFDPVPAR